MAGPRTSIVHGLFQLSWPGPGSWAILRAESPTCTWVADCDWLGPESGPDLSWRATGSGFWGGGGEGRCEKDAGNYPWHWAPSADHSLTPLGLHTDFS